MKLLPKFAAVILSVGIAGSAQSESLGPLKANLAVELPRYGFDNVDLDSLSSTKLMHINHLVHSDKSVAQIRGNIGAILGDSLFKLFTK